MCAYLKAIIHLVSQSRPGIFPPPTTAKSRAASDGRTSDTRARRVVRYVRPLFPITVSGDLNSRVSQIRSEKGVPFEHAFMHSIEMNATYQVRTSIVVRFPWPTSSDKIILLLQVHRRPEVLYVGGGGGC
jgi:hypothetical protein